MGRITREGIRADSGQKFLVQIKCETPVVTIISLTILNDINDFFSKFLQSLNQVKNINKLFLINPKMDDRIFF